MKKVRDGFSNFRISTRFIGLIVLVAALGNLVLAGWASHGYRSTAIAEARDFAVSVHQMTLAGLTAMMISGQGERRSLFLEQIRQSNNIADLRVLGGDAVARQFGSKGREEANLAEEREALATGEPRFRVDGEGDNAVLIAVLPALAQTNYLGKNCRGCHAAAEGEVLGAVTMRISLAKAEQAVRDFQRRLALVALISLLLVVVPLFLSFDRLVTRPLQQMTLRLNQIAEARRVFDERLPVHGRDEVAEAAAALNRVIGRAKILMDQEQLAAEVFTHAMEGIVITDAAGRIRLVNPAFTAMTGYTAEEAVGHTPALLKSGRQGTDFYEDMWNALTVDGKWQGEIWNRRKNGEVYPEWLSISSVRDERGAIEQYIAIFGDITERKSIEEIMKYHASHDPVTGLANRRLFLDRLTQQILTARRHKDAPVAVMFLDLDRFKHINDTLGHEAGDQLLKQVAQRLRSTVRESDTVARVGGDEFTVLLPWPTQRAAALTVAAKLVKAMNKSFDLAGQPVTVTTSIGVSVFPQDGDDPESLLRSADTAMYTVKQRGRAGFAFATSPVPAEAAE